MGRKEEGGPNGVTVIWWMQEKRGDEVKEIG